MEKKISPYETGNTLTTLEKNIRELVWYIGIEQTEEDLQKVLSLQPDEMLYALMKFKELHSRSVFYPK